MNAPPPRLRDICARTGLSAGTVSLALRGQGEVSLETRSRVLAAARALGYDLRRLRGPGAGGHGPRGEREPRDGSRPRTAPRTLTADGLVAPAAGPAASRAWRRMVVVYPGWPAVPAGDHPERSLNTGFYARGVQAAARDLRVDLVFLPALGGDHDPFVHDVLFDAPAGGAPDGVLLLGFGDDDPAVRRALAFEAGGVPVVAVCRHLPGLPCSWVAVPQEPAAGRLAEHLLDAGYERLAFVAASYQRFPWERQRLEGCRRALARRGAAGALALEVAGLLSAAGTVDGSAVHELERFVRRSAVPAAVFCAADEIALAVRGALQGRGLTAPGDYGIAGFDNSADRLAGAPARLTSVGYPRERVGALALRLLRDLCDDPGIGSHRVVMRPELHARDSTDRAGRG